MARVVQLSWQPGFSRERKPVKRTIVRRSRRRLPVDPSAPREFEFVNEQFPRATEIHSSGSSAKGSPDLRQPFSNQEIDTPKESVHWRTNEFVAEQSFIADPKCLDVFSTQLWPIESGSFIQSSDDGRESIQSISLLKSSSTSPSESDEDFLYVHDTPAPISGNSPTILSKLNAIPPTILYDWQLTRLEPVFERCKIFRRVTYLLNCKRLMFVPDDHEFSVIPLTFDLIHNPFRCTREALKESDFLLHAVLALSCHHTDNQRSSPKQRKASSVVLEHGQIALRLLRQTLGSGDSVVQLSSSLLDAIIVLFSLDVSRADPDRAERPFVAQMLKTLEKEAYSIVGSWTAHLSGAYNILQALGGIDAWIDNPKTVVQVALLAWYVAMCFLNFFSEITPESFDTCLMWFS